jgi:hypothetical protein
LDLECFEQVEPLKLHVLRALQDLYHIPHVLRERVQDLLDQIGFVRKIVLRMLAFE